MQRHILDRSSSARERSLLEAVRIERSRAPSRATLELQRRSRGKSARLRTQHFLRVAKAADGYF